MTSERTLQASGRKRPAPRPQPTAESPAPPARAAPVDLAAWMRALIAGNPAGLTPSDLAVLRVQAEAIRPCPDAATPTRPPEVVIRDLAGASGSLGSSADRGKPASAVVAERAVLSWFRISRATAMAAVLDTTISVKLNWGWLRQVVSCGPGTASVIS